MHFIYIISFNLLNGHPSNYYSHFTDEFKRWGIKRLGNFTKGDTAKILN